MSKRPHRTRARGRLAACLLCLLLLPGCLTQALWEVDTEVMTTPQLVAAHTDRSEGTLDHTDTAVVWRGLDGGEVWARPQGQDAELVMAALSHPQFCEVHEAQLDWSRVTCDAEVLEESSHLGLILRLRRAEIAEAVSPLDLTPAALAHLNGGSSVDEHVPLVFRQAAFQLSAIDVNWLVARQGALKIGAMVYVDAAGEPMFLGEMTGYKGIARPNLMERLDELARARLLVRLDGGAAPVLMQLRSDRLWLLSMLRVVGGRAVLRAPVALLTGESGNPAIGSQNVPATYVQKVTRYQRTSAEHESMSIWAKVALTPFALAVDLVLGIAWNAAFGDDYNDDDNYEDVQTSRSSHEAGPRRPGESEQQWRARVHAWQTGGR